MAKPTKTRIDPPMEAINFYELEKIIDYIDPSIPIMLHGPPGIGKSAFTLNHPKLNPCMQIGLATRQPEDISGCPIPLVDEGITKFLPLDWLKIYSIGGPQGQDPRGCIFFDEYDKGTPEKQVAVMRLLSEREMEGMKIGPNVRIILAANRREDQAGSYHDMPRVVRNRLMHFEVVPDFKYWCNKYAYAHGNVNPIVTTYLGKNKDDFVKYDPKTSDFGFPTARSWTGVGKVMDALAASKAARASSTTDESVQEGMDGELARKCIVGLVGQGIGNKFKSMIEYMDRLPELDDLANGTARFPEEEQFDEWIALVSACVAHAEGGIREGLEKDFSALNLVCRVIMAFPQTPTAKEFQLLLVRNLNERPSTEDYFLDEEFNGEPEFNAAIADILKQLRDEQDASGLM